ncbi:MAG: radical SAM protein [Methylothermaceae bacterium]|nr:radical SAM protein [Methylothermaceae bacterium]
MNSQNKQTHLFGPVPSRRLGRSLGVDLVPFKTCTFDCVYCQLGRTTDLTMERQAFVSPQVILDELRERLAVADRPDFITLSGSGEPTLCEGLGRIIRGIKTFTDVPVAVLTNGSLLWSEEVRQELMDADLVVPSLDAGDDKLYRYINRPCGGLAFDQLVEGLVAFRQECNKPIWLEVFLLSGVNSVEADVRRIADIAKRIGPDKVQLNTVARPPAEEFAMAVPEEQMEKLARLFEVETDIVADYRNIHEASDVVSSREDVLTLLRRRPCTVEDVASGLGIHRNEVVKHLGELVQQGRVTTHMTNSKSYYQAKQETTI